MVNGDLGDKDLARNAGRASRDGTPEERNHFEIVGDGAYLHWPDLDEDLTVAGLLAGRHSGESLDSLHKWLDARTGRGESA